MRRQLLEVLPDQRLAARQAELQHAQLARLGEDPLPVVGPDLALGPERGRAGSSSRGSAADSGASAPPAASSDVRSSLDQLSLRQTATDTRSRRRSRRSGSARSARRRSRATVRLPVHQLEDGPAGVVQQHGALGIEQHRPLPGRVVVQPGQPPEPGHASERDAPRSVLAVGIVDRVDHGPQHLELERQRLEHLALRARASWPTRARCRARGSRRGAPAPAGS